MNFIEGFIYADSSSGEEESYIKDTRLKRKHLRDISDPLQLDDFIFKQRFRLTKTAFTFLEEKLGLQWGKTSAAIPPRLKLCATLEILSSGSYQSGTGNDYLIGMAQSTISEVFGDTIQKMEEDICVEFIKFEPSQASKNYFYEKFNFPGVVGCVDGTHIYMLKPSENEHSFINRKSRHSLNAMIICDEHMTIMAINATYGGSNHDSFIWNNSDERLYMMQYIQTNPNSWLLGDSGYPLEPWLMTPYRNPEQGSSEMKYNTIHCKSRSIVERCIGLLKCRWRILLSERQCRYKPEKLVQICNVCAALHNICIKLNISAQDINLTVEEEDILSPIVETPLSSRSRVLAEQQRNMIRDSFGE